MNQAHGNEEVMVFNEHYPMSIPTTMVDSSRTNNTTLLNQSFNYNTPKCNCTNEFPTAPQETEDINAGEEVTAENCLLHLSGADKKDENTCSFVYMFFCSEGKMALESSPKLSSGCSTD